jgi:hypothetical protein
MCAKSAISAISAKSPFLCDGSPGLWRSCLFVLPGGLSGLRRNVRIKLTKRAKSPRHLFSQQDDQAIDLIILLSVGGLPNRMCAESMQSAHSFFSCRLPGCPVLCRSGEACAPENGVVRWCIPNCQNCFIKRTHWAHPAQVVISALRRRPRGRGNAADRRDPSLSCGACPGRRPWVTVWFQERGVLVLVSLGVAAKSFVSRR